MQNAKTLILQISWKRQAFFQVLGALALMGRLARRGFHLVEAPLLQRVRSGVRGCIAAQRRGAVWFHLTTELSFDCL